MPFIRHLGRRGAYTAAATACALAGLALLAFAFLPHQQPPPAPPPTAAHAPAPADAEAWKTPVLARSAPVRVLAPKIGLRTAVQPVGLADDGSISLPKDADHAGWYTGSVTPGERGKAILVGHVDSASGPAVFYGLGALREGNRITVERRDGRQAVFTVTRMAVYSKDRFPSGQVYRSASGPQLTLITCADWDENKKDYRANLVITAHPAAHRAHKP